MNRDKKTDLLWISLFAPFPQANEAGSKTLSFYFEEIKRTKNFDITLIAFDTIKNKNHIENYLKDINHLVVYRDYTFKDNFKRLINIESKYNPWNRNGNSISNYTYFKVIQAINRLHSAGYTPEIVILDWTEMVVLSHVIRKVWPKSYIVADEVDVKYVGYKRRAERSNIITKGYKKLIYKNLKKHELLSLEKCDLIMPQNPDNAELLIQEGIEHQKIQWLVPYFQNMNDIIRNISNKDVLFFGAMNREENYLSAIWFIDNVVPFLDNSIRFVVMGGNPPKILQQKESDRVIITGFVNDIRPYFEHAMCMVAPLVLGAGIKVKVIEGLSSGIPVLTNNIGIEGIHVKNGHDYYHCEKAEEYVNIINDIAKNPVPSRIMGENARDKIESLFDLNDSFAKLYRTLMVNTNKMEKTDDYN